jgi:hypothetical protein
VLAIHRLGQLVRGGKREPGDIGVAVDVIGFDRVKAFGLSHLEARFHHWAENADLAEVKPLLPGSAGYSNALHRGREGTGVGTPIFIGSEAHIAHGMNVGRVNCGNQARICVKPIPVIHLYIQKATNGRHSRKLPLP